jgi:hypothetical protein
VRSDNTFGEELESLRPIPGVFWGPDAPFGATRDPFAPLDVPERRSPSCPRRRGRDHSPNDLRPAERSSENVISSYQTHVLLAQ